MSAIQIKKLNGLQRLNRRITVNPLLRTRLIWLSRIWLVNSFHFIGAMIEGIVKFIVKTILVIIAAFFLL